MGLAEETNRLIAFYTKVFVERCERKLEVVELLVVRVNERLSVLDEIRGEERGVYMHFWSP